MWRKGLKELGLERENSEGWMTGLVNVDTYLDTYMEGVWWGEICVTPLVCVTCFEKWSGNRKSRCRLTSTSRLRQTIKTELGCMIHLGKHSDRTGKKRGQSTTSPYDVPRLSIVASLSTVRYNRLPSPQTQWTTTSPKRRRKGRVRTRIYIGEVQYYLT